jgi:16S rRNA (cytosine1407-C5)-methyltransferase
MQSLSFDDFYRELYDGRWEALRQSLLTKAPPVAWTQGLVKPYFLDAASVLAAQSLRLDAAGERPDAGMEILDACAAPGGKTLVIAGRLTSGMKLLSNELSSERRSRLVRVLDEHLEPGLRSRVVVSGFDAAREGSRTGEQGRFAAILLDAPCSSEAHVLRSPPALAQWTPARPRFLARRQWSLLSAAFRLLAPGGSLVYATCSINSGENDGVAARLFAKYGAADRGGSVELDRPDFSEGEATDYGRIILPDREAGKGPLYVARFKKN